MQTSDVEIKRSGSTVTISRMVTLTGGELTAMNIQEGDSLTFDFTMALDVDELEKIISKEDASKPGFAKRVAEAVVTEGLKTAVKEAVVEFVKSLSS